MKINTHNQNKNKRSNKNQVSTKLQVEPFYLDDEFKDFLPESHRHFKSPYAFQKKEEEKYRNGGSIRISQIHRIQAGQSAKYCRMFPCQVLTFLREDNFAQKQWIWVSLIVQTDWGMLHYGSNLLYKLAKNEHDHWNVVARGQYARYFVYMNVYKLNRKKEIVDTKTIHVVAYDKPYARPNLVIEDIPACDSKFERSNSLLEDAFEFVEGMFDRTPCETGRVQGTDDNSGSSSSSGVRPFDNDSEDIIIPTADNPSIYTKLRNFVDMPTRVSNTSERINAFIEKASNSMDETQTFFVNKFNEIQRIIIDWFNSVTETIKSLGGNVLYLADIALVLASLYHIYANPSYSCKFLASTYIASFLVRHAPQFGDLCEKVRNMVQDDDTNKHNLLQKIVSVITSLIFKIDLNWILTKLALLGHACLGITRTYDLCVLIVNKIYDVLFEWYHGYSRHFDEKFSIEWCQEASALASVPATSSLQNIRLEAAIQTGIALSQEVSSNNAQYRRIQEHVKELKKRVTQEAKSALNGGTRCVPFVVYMYGESGVGKSFGARSMVNLMVQCLLNCSYEYAEHEICSINTLANFMDNYHNQFAVVIDDFGQLRDSLNNPSVEFMYLIQMVNNAPFMVDKAVAEEKGKCFFQSPLIFVTSNFAPAQLHIESVSYRPAIERRFSVDIYVEGTPESMLMSVAQVNNCHFPKIDSFVDKDYMIQYLLAQFLYHMDLQRRILCRMATCSAPQLPKFVNFTRQDQWDMFGDAHPDIKPEDWFERRSEIVTKAAIATAANFDKFIAESAEYTDMESKYLSYFTFKTKSDKINLTIQNINSFVNDLSVAETIKRDTICAALKDAGLKDMRCLVQEEINGKEEVEDCEELIELDESDDSSDSSEEDNDWDPNMAQSHFFVMHYEKNDDPTSLRLSKGLNIPFCNLCRYKDDTTFSHIDDYCKYNDTLGVKTIVQKGKLLIARKYQKFVKEFKKFFKKPYVKWTIAATLVSSVLAAIGIHMYFKKTADLIEGECQHSNGAIVKSSNKPQIIVHRGHTQDSLQLAYPDEFQICQSPLAQYLPKNDGNALQVMDKVLQNSFSIYKDSDGEISHNLGGVMLCNDCALTCRHIVPRFEPNDYVIFRFSKGVTHTYRWSDLIIEPYVYDGEVGDAIVIRLPRPLNGFKKIYHLYASMHDQIVKQPRVIALVGRSLRESGDINIIDTTSQFDLVKAKYIYGQNLNGKEVEYHLLKYYKYLVSTVNGDCGRQLIAQDVSFNQKILGQHVSQSDSGFGVSMVIDGPTLVALVEKKCVVTSDVGAMPVEVAHGVVQINDKVVNIKPCQDVEGVFLSEANGRYKPPPCQNQFYFSALVHWHGRGLTRAPAIMAPVVRDGVRIDPLLKAVAKLGRNEVYINNNFLDDATDDYFGTISSHMINVDKRVLTVEEGFFGVEGDKFIRSINADSSPGLPYTVLQPPKSRGKKFWINLETKWVHPLVLNSVLKRVRGALEGELFEVLWLDLSKSEKRSLEKIEQVKTRLYSCGPMCFNIAVRMYFGSFLSYMMHNRIKNESAVGINPYSLEWTLLAEHLKQKGPIVVAGDYGDFDGTLVLNVLWKCCDVINRWYDDSLENQNARRNLFSQIMSSTHYVKGLMYTIHHSNPSGNPMTAVLNTMFNCIINRYLYCCIMCVSIPNPIRSFRKYVTMVAYGDDNVINIDPSIYDRYNQETITVAHKSIGMTYTREDKQVGLSENRKLEDCTFLKRGFVFKEEYAMYVGPLDENVVLETPCFERRYLNDEEFNNLLSNVIHEMALHGPYFYYNWSTKLIQAAAPIRPTLNFRIPSYNSCMQEIKMGTFVPSESDY